MRPKGLVGESAGTFQLFAGVRGVVKTEDEDGKGDDGGSEPGNWRLFGPRVGVYDRGLADSARGRFGAMVGLGRVCLDMGEQSTQHRANLIRSRSHDYHMIAYKHRACYSRPTTGFFVITLEGGFTANENISD